MDATPQPPTQESAESDKKRLVALLLCFFFGLLSVHRFYVGKVGTALLQIVTFGGLGFWLLIDFILILVGAFKDKQGRALQAWT
jgi:TM2 domain-containing membrane protein YozV